MIFRERNVSGNAANNLERGLTTSLAETSRLFRSSEFADFNQRPPSSSVPIDSSRYLPNTLQPAPERGSMMDRFINRFRPGQPLSPPQGTPVEDYTQRPLSPLPIREVPPMEGVPPAAPVRGITIDGKYYTWQQLGQYRGPDTTVYRTDDPNNPIMRGAN
jgi:hypothetical protein